MRASIPPSSSPWKPARPLVGRRPPSLNERENQRVRCSGTELARSLLSFSFRRWQSTSERESVGRSVGRSGRTTKRAGAFLFLPSTPPPRRSLLMVPYTYDMCVRQFASERAEWTQRPVAVVNASAADTRTGGRRDGRPGDSRFAVSVCLMLSSLLSFRALWRHIARSANSRLARVSASSAPAPPQPRLPPSIDGCFFSESAIQSRE